MNATSDSKECLQVFIRCRPLQKLEKEMPVPVEVHPILNKIIVHDVGGNKNIIKTFSFDQVFGPETGQALIYNSVAAPLIQEVVMGFNCTILAYGQTGTGKTFTIEGDRNAALNTPEDSKAGIIPRSMNHIFKELTKQKCNFEVSVSFLELYNEEIFDLLSKTEDLIKLKLYESSKGSVQVQGLETRNVQSMQDVYDVLDKGCKKRRKAATLLNKMSSRSHTVFTVKVKMKEHSSTIEKTKIGKLNLVDLAGSENIGRSGAVEKRAREAGNINQSLLSLGRVITALCENAIHIPYRESKLTRLLRDSLGGQTKTSVIATISPSVFHIDETMNTLEYALRAKNIMNKPEINSQVSATALMKDYLQKTSSLEDEIREWSSKVEFQVHPDNLNYLETALEAIPRELREEWEINEKLRAECQEIDEAIAKAAEALSLKEIELKNCVSEQANVAEKQAKVQEEICFEEKEIMILEPITAKLHEKLHMVMKEKERIANDVKKMEETALDAETKLSRIEKQFSSMCRAESSFNEALLQFKTRLTNCITEVQITAKREEMECDKYLSSLHSECDSFAEGSEKFCQQFKNVMSDVEKLKSNLYETLTEELQNEEIKSQECLSDIKSNVSSLLFCNLDPLQPILTNCEENLRQSSESLAHWREKFIQKIASQESLLNNYLSAEDKNLRLLKESCKDVTQKHKEFIEEYSALISSALSNETECKTNFDEKVRVLEEGVAQMQSFLIEKLDEDVDRSISAHDKFREHAEGEMRKVEAVMTFCESSKDSLEAFNRGISFSSNQALVNKMEAMRENVNNAIANYNDLLPEFTNCVNKTKVSDQIIKDLEQRVADAKSRRLEMINIISAIQNFKENLSAKDQCITNVYNEHEAELKTLETTQISTLKAVEKSFNQLHDTYTRGVSANITSIEESETWGFSWKEAIIKENYNDVENPDKTDSSRDKAGNNPDNQSTSLPAENNESSEKDSVMDTTFTLSKEKTDNENETGCIFCKSKDETLAAQNILSISTTKPRERANSKSSKQDKNRKEVAYSDLVEKWCRELFDDDSDAETTISDQSDPVA